MKWLDDMSGWTTIVARRYLLLDDGSDGSGWTTSCANHLFTPIKLYHYYFFGTNKLFAPVI